jgi:hypothetical protein
MAQGDSASIFLFMIHDDDQYSSPFHTGITQQTDGYVKVGPISYTAEAAAQVIELQLYSSSIPYNVTMFLDNVSMIG